MLPLHDVLQILYYLIFILEDLQHMHEFKKTKVKTLAYGAHSSSLRNL